MFQFNILVIKSLECLEQNLLMVHPNVTRNLVQRIHSLAEQVMDHNTKLIYLRQYNTMILRTLIRIFLVCNKQ